MKLLLYIFAFTVMLLVSLEPAWASVNLHTDGLTPSHTGLNAEEDGLCHRMADLDIAHRMAAVTDAQQSCRDCELSVTLESPDASIDRPPQPVL